MPTTDRKPMMEVAAPPPAAPVPQVLDHHTAMIQMIERVALDPNASLEKLERMLDMKERLDDRAREERAREAEGEYYRAMAACQSKLKVVVKNKKNAQTHSTYADLAALARQADPIIHEHGFTTSFQPGGRNEHGQEIVKWSIAHVGGHIERGEAALSVDDKGPKGEVNKTALHGFGSTMSYGRRYLKLMLFDIATADDDGNAASAAPKGTITEDQFRLLRALMDQVGANDAQFCTAFGITMLAELPADRFDGAKAALWQKKAVALEKAAKAKAEEGKTNA